MRRWWIFLGVAVVILAAFGVVARHIRRTVVPPSCTDPRTLTLVRQSLLNQFHLPPSTRLERIDMKAGGWLAFRFVCQADLDIPEKDLPPGPRPGSVHYISILGNNGRQQVTVTIAPLLQWIIVQ